MPLADFFARQSSLAGALWSLFDDPALLPPFGVRELLTHIARSPRYLPLAPWINRTLADLVAAHGLDGFEPLRAWFAALYEVLLGQSQGPRFGSFAALFGTAQTSAMIRAALAGEFLK